MMIARFNGLANQNGEESGMAYDGIGKRMLTQMQWEFVGEQMRLTAREKEVCQELFDGCTRNEIAESLGIKPRTVRHYMENIHSKLFVSNRVGVVLRIIELRDCHIAKEQDQSDDDSGPEANSSECG